MCKLWSLNIGRQVEKEVGTQDNVAASTDTITLLCHLEKIIECFPAKDVKGMDNDQFMILLLSTTFNITYNEVGGNVAKIVAVV